jgi:hypothetical protein
MKLIKENKFYIVMLDKNIEIEKPQKNKQKFWNNRKWKHRRKK